MPTARQNAAKLLDRAIETALASPGVVSSHQLAGSLRMVKQALLAEATPDVEIPTDTQHNGYDAPTPATLAVPAPDAPTPETLAVPAAKPAAHRRRR